MEDMENDIMCKVYSLEAEEIKQSGCAVNLSTHSSRSKRVRMK